MARVGQAAAPPIPVPRPLRPLVRFAKLHDAALGTVRRILDEDDGFRAHVLATLDIAGFRGELDEASLLFLGRPEGWEERLDALAGAAAQVAATATAERADAAASRRVEVVQGALDRAEASLGPMREAAAGLRAQVAEERRARRIADSELGRLRKRIAELESRAEALDEEAALAASRAVQAPAPTAPAGPGVDRIAVGEAVSAAVAAVGSLAEALGRAAEALGPTTVDGDVWSPADTLPRGAGGRRASAPRAGGDRPARKPVPLPPAVFDDTTAAAEHLLRVPGALVLVDGYNVTLTTKGELALPDQRRWLLDAVAGAAARTGAEFEIVFDGAAAGGPAAGPRRLGVHVQFTSAEVEADDVVLALVAGLPLERPVVVVSDDHRVRDGARRLGANVVGVGQLVEALRR